MDIKIDEIKTIKARISKEYKRYLNKKTVVKINPVEDTIKQLESAIDNLTGKLNSGKLITERQKKRYEAKAKTCKAYLKDGEYSDLVEFYKIAYVQKYNKSISKIKICKIIIEHYEMSKELRVLGYLDYIRTKLKAYLRNTGKVDEVRDIILKLNSIKKINDIKELSKYIDKRN
jgi:hypothetical protein